MKLLKEYFMNVFESVARKGKRKLLRIKLEILNAIINAPSAIPIMKNGRTPVFPKYSGSKNKYGIPKRVAIVCVMNPKSISQYNIII
jgi:hypothetical protein